MRGAELIELASVGSSLIVGTVSIDGEPRATRAWSVHRRCVAKHQTILAAEHSRALRDLRIETKVISAFNAALDDIEERDLGDYDRVLGLV